MKKPVIILKNIEWDINVEWDNYDALELAACYESDQEVSRIEEEKDDRLPHFYTIYAHLKTGGVDAILDLSNPYRCELIAETICNEFKHINGITDWIPKRFYYYKPITSAHKATYIKYFIEITTNEVSYDEAYKEGLHQVLAFELVNRINGLFTANYANNSLTRIYLEIGPEYDNEKTCKNL